MKREIWRCCYHSPPLIKLDNSSLGHSQLYPRAAAANYPYEIRLNSLFIPESIGQPCFRQLGVDHACYCRPSKNSDRPFEEPFLSIMKEPLWKNGEITNPRTWKKRGKNSTNTRGMEIIRASEIKILSLEQDFVSREKKRVIFFLIRVSSSLILVYDSYRKGCKEILVSRVQPTRS